MFGERQAFGLSHRPKSIARELPIGFGRRHSVRGPESHRRHGIVWLHNDVLRRDTHNATRAVLLVRTLCRLQADFHSELEDGK